MYATITTGGVSALLNAATESRHRESIRVS
jgi:hypothetical protein